MTEGIAEPIDDLMSLEAVYLSAPMPRDLAALTVMATVFDRIHFPGVYLPVTDIDIPALDKEIERIRAIGPSRMDGGFLVGMLMFARYAKTLRGLCVLESDPSAALRDRVANSDVNELYQAIHGPNPANWQPIFDNANTKSVGDGECVAYPGQYHYLLGAIRYSSETNIPLLNDVPGIPIPLPPGESLRYDTKLLSAMIAIKCVTLALPKLPLLHPEDLMEFREENEVSLRNFRRALLKYAGKLRTELKGVPAEELEDATRAFVQTDVLPHLDELSDRLRAAPRSWMDRAIQAISLTPEVIPAILSMDPNALITKALMSVGPRAIASELGARIKHRALRREELYYLLRVQGLAARS